MGNRFTASSREYIRVEVLISYEKIYRAGVCLLWRFFRCAIISLMQLELYRACSIIKGEKKMTSSIYMQLNNKAMSFVYTRTITYLFLPSSGRILTSLYAFAPERAASILLRIYILYIGIDFALPSSLIFFSL